MNVPQLRFSEFDGEWESKELKELVRYTKGFAFKSESFINKGYRIIRVSDLLENTIRRNNEQVFISSTDSERYEKYKVVKDNILVTTVGSRPELTNSAVGRAIYISGNENLYLNQNLLKFESNEDVNNFFIYTNLKMLKYRDYISKIQRGNANQSNITVVDLLKYEIQVPSYEEQMKIGRFFFLLSKRIKKQQEKIKKLEEFRKGMMQKVFSQELRFKNEEGGEFQEWEEKKLHTLISSKRKGAEAKYSTSGNILLHNDYLEFEANIKYVENKNDVIEEDILILWDGSQAGNIYTKRTGVLGSTFVAISIKQSYDPYYIYHYLINKVLLIKVAWREGSGVPHVSKDFINNFSIKIPKSKKEQKMISNVLFELEKKVKKEKEKLMSLEEQKQGLIQGMFV